MGGVIEGPVVATKLAGKGRALLVRIATYRDDRLHFLLEEFLQ